MVNHVGKYTLHRWSDGSATLSYSVSPGGWFAAPPPEKLPGWTCFFHAHHGSDRVNYTYRHNERHARRAAAKAAS